MAAINSTLKVSVDELKKASTEFGKNATDVKRITDQMLQLIGETKTVWRGEAQQSYNTKFNQHQQDMNEFFKKVDEYRSDLDEIARNYQSAEEANKAAASALKTDVIH